MEACCNTARNEDRCNCTIYRYRGQDRFNRSNRNWNDPGHSSAPGNGSTDFCITLLRDVRTFDSDYSFSVFQHPARLARSGGSNATWDGYISTPHSRRKEYEQQRQLVHRSGKSHEYSMVRRFWRAISAHLPSLSPILRGVHLRVVWRGKWERGEHLLMWQISWKKDTEYLRGTGLK